MILILHLNNITIRSQTTKMNSLPSSQSVPSVPTHPVYPKVFNKNYLESKVTEVQPNGKEIKKADRMYLLGTSYILKESISNGVAEFSVESQTDADGNLCKRVVWQNHMANSPYSHSPLRMKYCHESQGKYPY